MEENDKQSKFFDAINCSAKTNYTQISNILIRDKKISFKARGILCLLLSNKEGWKTFIEVLSSTFSDKDGRTSVESGLKELEENGYLKRMVFKDKNTKRIISSFVAYTDSPFRFNIEYHQEQAELNGWEIGTHPKKTDYPITDNPITGFPSMGIPVIENQQQIRLINNKTKDNETNLNNSLLRKDNTSFQDENVSSTKTLEASNDIPKKTNRPLKNMMSISAPESSVQIISFWCNLGFPNHRPGTKTYNQILNSIRKLNNGTFFNDTSLTQYFDTKFSDDQIKEIIQKFSLAAFNLDYNPPPSEYKDYLKKVSFLNFLYNPKANKEKSLFIKFYEKIPELAKESNRTRKDAFPDLTNTLKKVYTQKILGGVQIDSWGNVHENKFILASQLLNDFFAKNRSKISNHFLSRGNLDKCEYLIDSIIQDIGENNLGKISPSWLCSPETLNRRLPAYLSMQNIISR